jgi:hypothetical protein
MRILPQLSRTEKAVLVLAVIIEVINVWLMLQSRAGLL